MSDTTTTGAGGSTDTADVAANKAKAVTSTAQDKAGDVALEAVDHAKDLFGEARTSMRSQAESQGSQLSTLAREFADELRSMASASRDTDSGRLSGFAKEGADRLERFCDRFDQDGLDAVSDDAKRFARTKPSVFLGSTFVAGLAAGRLVRYTDHERVKRAVKEEVSDDSSPTGSSSDVRSTPPPPATGDASIPPQSPVGRS